MKGIFFACRLQDENTARRYLRLRDKQGRTALHIAVIAGSVNCVQYIWEKWNQSGVFEDEDRFDRKVMFLAAKHNRLDIIKV